MTPRENELSQQLFGGKQQSMGAMGAVKEAFLAIAPGLKDMIPEAKTELKQIGAHGAHELASLLFTGQGYVQYQHQGKDDQPTHEQPQDSQAMQQDTPNQHLERGGRSM